jgi:parallel beta-helix repeat protein
MNVGRGESFVKKIISIAASIILLLLANAHATEWYVSLEGDDSTGLTLDEAFTSINRAAGKVNPGDTIWVADGAYHEAVYIERSGDPEQWITFKAINRHGAKIRVDDDYSRAFEVRANYIIVDGFDLVASGTYGLGIHVTPGRHHITAINNDVHDCGESGIGSVDSDYIVVENNIVARNGWLMPYCGSGISLYGGFRSDSKPGFHNIVRNNISYGNDNGPDTHQTDGNGIIIDDLRCTQDWHDDSIAPEDGYNGIETLVEGNLCFNNGGAGVMVYLSNNVTVRNNTCYGNNTRVKDGDNSRLGEIATNEASDITIANNIAVCNTDIRSQNTGLMVAQYQSPVSNVVCANNQTYNIADPDDSAHSIVGSAEISLLTDNLFGCDPLFVNPSPDPAVTDFRLQDSSSAVNSGTDAYGTATFDLDGNQRVIRVIDRGAYESSSTADPVPCEGPENQVTVESSPATIPPAGPLNITVDYVTDGDANLLAILFDANWEWISTGMVGVSTGHGTEVVNVPIESNLKEETHHILISLRDLNDHEKASCWANVDVVGGEEDQPVVLESEDFESGMGNWVNVTGEDTHELMNGDGTPTVRHR